MKCLCDLTFYQCDPNCCCDPDCSDSEKAIFTECDVSGVKRGAGEEGRESGDRRVVIDLSFSFFPQESLQMTLYVWMRVTCQ